MRDLKNFFATDISFRKFFAFKNRFNEVEIEEFLKDAGTHTVYAYRQYTDEEGNIKPARLVYQTGCKFHNRSKELYGRASFPELVLPDVFEGQFWERDDNTGETWYNNVINLRKQERVVYDSLPDDSVMGYEWNPTHNHWFPIRKSDITEIRERP